MSGFTKLTVLTEISFKRFIAVREIVYNCARRVACSNVLFAAINDMRTSGRMDL